jgi:hypothetical protein
LSQPDVENDLVFLRQLSTDEQAQNGQDGSEIDKWPENIEKPLDTYYGSNNTSSSDMGNIGRFLSDIRGYLFCNYSGSDATGWNGISPFFCYRTISRFNSTNTYPNGTTSIDETHQHAAEYNTTYELGQTSNIVLQPTIAATLPSSSITTSNILWTTKSNQSSSTTLSPTKTTTQGPQSTSSLPPAHKSPPAHLAGPPGSVLLCQSDATDVGECVAVDPCGPCAGCRNLDDPCLERGGTCALKGPGILGPCHTCALRHARVPTGVFARFYTLIPGDVWPPQDRSCTPAPGGWGGVSPVALLREVDGPIVVELEATACAVFVGAHNHSTVCR